MERKKKQPIHHKVAGKLRRLAKEANEIDQWLRDNADPEGCSGKHENALIAKLEKLDEELLSITSQYTQQELQTIQDPHFNNGVYDSRDWAKEEE